MEIDTAPSLYLAHREFTGQLIERQLHRPLFAERGDTVIGDLLDTQSHRAHVWDFQVRDDAFWRSGARVEAHQVVARLCRVCRQPRGAWLAALLQRLEILDSRTLRATTRFPVAELDRVFASPALAPRQESDSTGNYQIAEVSTRRTVLQPCLPGPSRIELITTRTRLEGKQLYRSGRLDIGWGVGVPPGFWSERDGDAFTPPESLDMHVVLVAGRLTPLAEVESVTNTLASESELPAGVQATVTRFGTRESPSWRRTDQSSRGRWPLYYAPFPPNEDLTRWLRTASNAKLIPRPTSYESMLAGTSSQDGFSVQIHATQFPGELGMLTESAFVARGSLPGAEHLVEVARQAWGTSSADVRAHHLRMLEAPLDRLLGRRVIGRLRSRFRSRLSLDVPRTGWIDFSHLSRNGRRT